jgi:putative membrane protein
MTEAHVAAAAAAATGAADHERVGALERPHKNLFWYYALQSLLVGPLFFIPLLPLYFKYHTLRYRFDEQGVSMRWGILFRREISLNYARIQDIHLASNFVERWLGLARVQIQTAAGSAGAEMTIEGLQEYQEVRDFLYTRMRGARRLGPARAGQPTAAPAASVSGGDAVVEALREVASELRAVRALLERGRPAPGSQPANGPRLPPTGAA